MKTPTKLLIFAHCALFIFSLSAKAEWLDNFNGGLQQAWTFDSLSQGTLTSSSTFSGLGTSNRLQLSDSTSALNNGALYGFGVVETESFTDVAVSGTINPGKSSFISQTHMLIARADLADSTYYAAGINVQLNDLMVYRSDGPGMTTTLSSAPVAGLSFTEDYYIDFVLEGDELTATLYDQSGGNEIESVTAVDATLTDGHAGVLGQSGSGEAILSVWDNVSAVAVPEPSGIRLMVMAFYGFMCFWPAAKN